MWEYSRVEIGFKTYLELNEKLTNEGKNGWEVIWYNELEPTNLRGKQTASILLKRYINTSSN